MVYNPCFIWRNGAHGTLIYSKSYGMYGMVCMVWSLLIVVVVVVVVVVVEKKTVYK